MAVVIPLDRWARAQKLLSEIKDCFQKCLESLNQGNNTVRFESEHVCVAVTISRHKEDFVKTADAWMDKP